MHWTQSVISVCLSVLVRVTPCVCVGRISEKVMNGFLLNFLQGARMVQGGIGYSLDFFVTIRIVSWILIFQDCSSLRDSPSDRLRKAFFSNSSAEFNETYRRVIWRKIGILFVDRSAYIGSGFL